MTDAVELTFPKILWKCCASNSCFDLGSWSSGLAAAQSWLAAPSTTPPLADHRQMPAAWRRSRKLGSLPWWSSLHITRTHYGIIPSKAGLRWFQNSFTSDQQPKPWLAIPKCDQLRKSRGLLRNKELCSRSRLEALRAASVRETKSKREKTCDTWRLVAWTHVGAFDKAWHARKSSPKSCKHMKLSKNAKAAWNSGAEPLEQPQKHFLKNHLAWPFQSQQDVNPKLEYSMSPAKRSHELPSNQVHIFISSNQCRALVQCFTQRRAKGEAEVISVGKLCFHAVHPVLHLTEVFPCCVGMFALLSDWFRVLPERSRISM